MLAPLSWLRDFAPLEADPEVLADTLSGLGLVVEGLERVGEGLGDMVVARVLATRSHPDADQVQLVDVDTGNGDSLQIVCGAFNFSAGDLVPLAPVGARLPGGMEIGRRKVRGQWSEGMLCSGRELGLSDDHEGIMVLPAGHAPGSALTEALGITPDVVFDIDVTPNRPDALSMAGVARDLAAKLGVPFSLPDGDRGGARAWAAGHPVMADPRVEAPDLCGRFTATLLVEVKVGPSPSWLAGRLLRSGMRPINNVVDISNYVMLELGHPNHPYDLDRLPGGALVVRRALHGEVLTTLDGAERRLGGEDCVIADRSGAGVGIGGIMGGESTEISPDTTAVVLEMAWFEPVSTARTAKRLGVRTEASARFERGVDPEGIDRAVARFCALAADLAGAVPSPTTADVRAEGLPGPVRVTVRTERVNGILGTTMTATEVRGHLEPIGFACEPLDGGSFEVSIPSWRPDSTREIDVVEEVARLHGYGNIARTLPATTQTGRLNSYQHARRQVRSVLRGLGISEAWATSFLAPEHLEKAGLSGPAVEVENPLAAEESVLRPSLRPGLLEALLLNQSHRRGEVALFEIGHVFLPPSAGDQLPEEPERLAVALGGADATETKRVLDTLTGAMKIEDVSLVPDGPQGLHPTRSVRVLLGGTAIGELGEIDPAVLARYTLESRVGWLELDLGVLLRAPRRPLVYRPVSRYPSADIDLAFVVDETTPADAVERTLREAGGDLVEEIRLFDVYRGPNLGEGRRSLAFRLRFCALDHTLADHELGSLRQACIDSVEARHPAQLRG